ncbi:hypothetical protein pipiens_006365 [Culex pipiens pipiens]|uniref:Uncharacterized protein n=1 Tax=Culex pipiens pipiens TaxID=38569 RepID=A0ABD1DPW9_CULPP
MLCHYQLLVCYLSGLVADCWSSTSEYLIIRHGRSRVRHSSEKDHIRWGLQVFDNFTLLDYDTVDDSNETMSGSGAGGSHKSPSPRTNGRPGGGEQFLDNSDTLTIQFNTFLAMFKARDNDEGCCGVELEHKRLIVQRRIFLPDLIRHHRVCFFFCSFSPHWVGFKLSLT